MASNLFAANVFFARPVLVSIEVILWRSDFELISFL